MSMPFIYFWIFIAASVLGTGVLWHFVRSVSRDGWPSRKRPHKPDESELKAERERQQRKELDAKDRSSAKRRRDDARAKCELLYTVCAPEVGNRFTKAMLDTFIRNYMGDDRSPEEVEERARQLEGILDEHRTAVRPPPRFKDIGDLANWYIAEKKRIEDLPVDPMFKEQHLVQLHTRYAELTQEIMER